MNKPHSNVIFARTLGNQYCPLSQSQNQFTFRRPPGRLHTDVTQTRPTRRQRTISHKTPSAVRSERSRSEEAHIVVGGLFIESAGWFGNIFFFTKSLLTGLTVDRKKKALTWACDGRRVENCDRSVAMSTRHFSSLDRTCRRLARDGAVGYLVLKSFCVY